MPNELLSNNTVKVTEDEAMDGKVILRIKTRKTEIGVAVLIGREEITVLPSHGCKMEVVTHNGAGAVSVLK